MISTDVNLESRGNLGQYTMTDSQARIDSTSRIDSVDASGIPHGSIVARRREFENYVYVKGREIDEQRLSWRYYHVDQWTMEQLRILRRRQQPAITFDRTGRKIDSLSGTIRRLRTDPKVFPNTPNGEQGAEVATQVIRTICDASRSEDLEVECCRDALIHGIGVSEMTMRKGDKADPDIGFNYVDPRTWFYDPRSTRSDFSDTKFHGVYKWADSDELESLFPGSIDVIRQSINNDGNYWTAFDADREPMWIDIYHRVRLVDHWYKKGNVWYWSLHTGIVELLSGPSPYVNQRGQSISKFNAFAAFVDIHGDHYGMVRRLRGPQDAINQHRSKAIHIMNTRQVLLKEGVVDDVEVTRREAARPDGVIVYRGDRKDLEIVSPDQEFLQQTNYYNDAKSEIDTYGPNQQLIQQFGQNVSGRAGNLLQQAGLAELGPFLKNFRMWKLDRYRACWLAAQKYWTADRMLRVTNDTGVSQFMQINGVQLNEFGLPILVNMLGNIDVEILIDEGPDNETVMGDVFDLLMAMAQNQMPIPPAVLVEMSALPVSAKKKLQGMLGQVDPAKAQMQQLMMQDKAADIQKKQAEVGHIQSGGLLNVAKAHHEGGAPPPPPDPLDQAQKLADINETNATAAHKRASATQLYHNALFSPLQTLADHAQQTADRQVDHIHRNADRLQQGMLDLHKLRMEHAHRNADRIQDALNQQAQAQSAQAQQPPPQQGQQP